MFIRAGSGVFEVIRYEMIRYASFDQLFSGLLAASVNIFASMVNGVRYSAWIGLM